LWVFIDSFLFVVMKTVATQLFRHRRSWVKETLVGLISLPRDLYSAKFPKQRLAQAKVCTKEISKALEQSVFIYCAFQ